MMKFLEVLKKLGWLGTAVATLAVGVWVAVTYLNDQRLNYARSFSEKQLEISYAAVDTVAGLITARTAEEWEQDRSKFWQLYYGELVLFETDLTASTMDDLSRVLEKMEFEQRQSLRPYALHVSTSLRKFIGERNHDDWRLSFDTVKGF